MNKQPAEHLKSMIKTETEAFNERVLNMVKLWDQKIANLRSELNIQSIYRKLNTFPKKEEVKSQIDDLQKEIKQTYGTIMSLKIMIGKVGQLNEGTENKI